MMPNQRAPSESDQVGLEVLREEGEQGDEEQTFEGRASIWLGYGVLVDDGLNRTVDDFVAAQSTLEQSVSTCFNKQCHKSLRFK